MSNFKIQQGVAMGRMETRSIKIPNLPQVILPNQTLGLQYYDVEMLLNVLRQYTNGKSTKSLVIRTLKIVANSLSDTNLLKGLEGILQLADKQKVYELMLIWAQTGANLMEILRKLSNKMSKIVMKIIFGCYFLKIKPVETIISYQISMLLIIEDRTILLNSVKQEFHRLGQPLKILLTKCSQLKTQNNQLKAFIHDLIKMAVESSQGKFIELVQSINESQEQLKFLIKQLPNVSTTIIKYLKKMLNQENVLSNYENQPQFNNLFRVAAKQWLQEPNCFWKTVDLNFFGHIAKKEAILKLSREIGKQQIVQNSFSTKYLYQYFQGQQFQFDQEDRLLSSKNSHQQWIDTYKSISQCQSFQSFNIIALNVCNSIKHWNKLNPFNLKFNSKGVAKLVEKYRQYYEQKKKQFLQKNKNLELVYSVVQITIRQGKNQWLSFEQLRRHIESGLELQNMNFKDQYSPFKNQILIKQQIKKDHNIIVEAKLVRLLKKSKTGINAIFLSKESGYQLNVVEMGLKRLCNKGLAEQQPNNLIYTYII